MVEQSANEPEVAGSNLSTGLSRKVLIKIFKLSLKLLGKGSGLFRLDRDTGRVFLVTLPQTFFFSSSLMLRQNKLECLPLTTTFQAILMLTNEAVLVTPVG